MSSLGSSLPLSLDAFIPATEVREGNAMLKIAQLAKEVRELVLQQDKLKKALKKKQNQTSNLSESDELKKMDKGQTLLAKQLEAIGARIEEQNANIAKARETPEVIIRMITHIYASCVLF
eukprot:GHVT01069873.1.p2 GENE.GHVT01069873.1~~GHVT01069873.1.p2  ORF type:complete len:120 (-),score=19.02 GHVT01069873.1:1601-1960(-)